MKSLSIRQKLYYYLEEPHKSIVSLIYNVLSIGCALTLTLSNILLGQNAPPQLVVYNLFLTIFFMIDYILRVFAHDKKYFSYIFSFTGLCDLISWFPDAVVLLIKPFIDYETWKYLAFHPTMILFRILRTLTVTRLFVLPSLSPIITSLKHALWEPRASYGVLFMALFMIIIVFGGIYYVVERGEFNMITGRWMLNPTTPASVQSYVEAIWLCVISITTVGYGDISPYTDAGKLIVVLLVFFGLLFLAIPTAIVTTYYQESYDSLTQENKRDDKKLGELIPSFEKKEEIIRQIENLLEQLKECN
eukprot:TRINITY_DN2226_c0_g2_i1.p1 TRINITY_DN2226_c0_g2~~TRINITY_DN2226_c0_g2_i1.p1  ORF type:complete len:313 (-),score=46.47 TRINITY_DN2226_c0_g2_i1:267-1178(-)